MALEICGHACVVIELKWMIMWLLSDRMTLLFSELDVSLPFKAQSQRHICLDTCAVVRCIVLLTCSVIIWVLQNVNEMLFDSYHYNAWKNQFRSGSWFLYMLYFSPTRCHRGSGGSIHEHPQQLRILLLLTFHMSFSFCPFKYFELDIKLKEQTVVMI